MQQELFKKLAEYKLSEDYLDKYEDLIYLIRTLRELLTFESNPELELFAIHLTLDARNHILGMAYSKKYEMSNIGGRIGSETLQLLGSMSDSKADLLKFQIDDAISDVTHPRPHALASVIRYFSPWSFYLVETTNKKTLYFLNHGLEFSEQIRELDRIESYTIDKQEKAFETLYSIIENARVRSFIERLRS